MFFRPEIKDFIKNTLILTLFFTLVLDLSWSYVAPYLGIGASAGSNDSRFVQADNTYLGNVATALSLSLGQKEKQKTLILGWTMLSNDTLSISELISHPKESQSRLIGGHMQALTQYANVLSVDITKMLDSATDRQKALDEHISLLKNYGNVTNEKIKVLSEQILDLKNFIIENGDTWTSAKWALQTSLTTMNYVWVDAAIDAYTKAKDSENHSRIYLVYLDRFAAMYTKMQDKNRKILDTLSNNREALIKRSTVVIPASWTDILKELWVIKSEAEIKAEQSLN